MKDSSDPSAIASPEYRQFVEELKARVISARISVARSANRDLIMLYWDIGREIVERQRLLGWGESVVEMVAADLRREFPGMRGFSANNVWLMRQFFSEYSAAEFLEQLVQEMKKGGRRFLAQAVPELANPAHSSLPTQTPAILEQPILAYDILPNKYFYRYQPSTPAKNLLAEFWKLEKEAERMLEGLAK